MTVPLDLDANATEPLRPAARAADRPAMPLPTTSTSQCAKRFS